MRKKSNLSIRPIRDFLQTHWLNALAEHWVNGFAKNPYYTANWSHVITYIECNKLPSFAVRKISVDLSHIKFECKNTASKLIFKNKFFKIDQWIQIFKAVCCIQVSVTKTINPVQTMILRAILLSKKDIFVQEGGHLLWWPVINFPVPPYKMCKKVLVLPEGAQLLTLICNTL